MISAGLAVETFTMEFAALRAQISDSDPHPIAFALMSADSALAASAVFAWQGGPTQSSRTIEARK